jgi:hypothetical protein
MAGREVGRGKGEWWADMEEVFHQDRKNKQI